MKKCLVPLLTPLFFTISSLYAQSNGQPSKAKLNEYRNNPHWVKMMEDPNTNYHEAVAAFKESWRGKPEPEELMRGESEEEGEREERSFISRLFKSEKREKAELIQYAMDYKRFKFWQIQHEGFVKPDGRVMTPEEIQALVEQELRNRQNPNK